MKVNMAIKECAEIHRELWYTQKLGVAQGYGPSPRDRELLVVLAQKLGIPNEEFISSDESKNITAQKYLIAMLETMEPLAQMFQDIWIYCERTLIRTSKNALDIEWNFNINGELIPIDFESFRKYEMLLNNTLDKEKFNKICTEFASACCKDNKSKGYSRNDPIPPKPQDADPISVASRIHDMCTRVKEEDLIQNGYFGATDAIPYLSAILNKNLWRQEDFAELKPLVDECYNRINLEDILSLPFWKFRWQIYELWCLIITLQLFESRGFTLAQSSDGASLLELGTRVVLNGDKDHFIDIFSGLRKDIICQAEDKKSLNYAYYQNILDQYMTNYFNLDLHDQEACNIFYNSFFSEPPLDKHGFLVIP
ncbi:hypothetical protein PROVRETT_09759 [Providencia rettgeri DSM 1131]|nr:hypothetical protein PROVRETT_09759 [Providencia rettgeri DSM 1131]